MPTELGKVNVNSPPHAAVRPLARPPEHRKTVLEQFFSLSEGRPCQLIAGEIIMSPSPIPLHQAIIIELSLQMMQFAKKNKAGRVSVRLLMRPLTKTPLFSRTYFLFARTTCPSSAIK